MALPFITAKAREFTDNGAPAAGYKLYTYEAGTTTNKASYSDAAATTANTNPVVLDSEGRASVYLVGQYKLVLKTDADVTVWTVDEYGEDSVASDSFVAFDTAPTFASTSTFTVASDRTADFIDDMRLKLTDATTLYGRVTAQTYAGGPDTTTVTVALDSGSLSASLTAVALGLGDVGLPIHAAHVATDSGTIESDIAAKLPTAGGTMTGELVLGDNLLTKPKLKDYSEAVDTNATATGTVDLDCEDGNIHSITLTGNTTITLSNPPGSGTAGCVTVVIAQDGTGGRTVAWPGSVEWAGGTAPVITSAASSVDVVTLFTIDAGTTWYGGLFGQDFS